MDKKRFTPKLGIILIVLFLVFSSIFLVSKRNENTSVTSSASQSPTNYTPAKTQGTGEIGDYYDGSQIKSATNSASPAPKAGDIKQYTYPNSVAKVSTASKLELESTASAQVVTDWYTNKIKNSNFNAKSSSQSNTDGNVLNKMSAAKPGEKIEITIKKDQSASKVLITVDRLN